MIKNLLKRWRERRAIRMDARARRRARKEASSAIASARQWGSDWRLGLGQLERAERAFEKLDLTYPLMVELIFSCVVLRDPSDYGGWEGGSKGLNFERLPAGLAEAIARGAQRQGAIALRALLVKVKGRQLQQSDAEGLDQLLVALERAWPETEAKEVAGCIGPGRKADGGAKRI